MEEKRSFGEYIHKKRLEAGLTQKELAGRLYVTESAVSKWERSLSYPDVSMVTAICAALGISEHEFFSACDDDQSRTQEKEARHWRFLSKGFQWFFAISYAVALLVCFICDLAIFHTLDWFWIVLSALALAFCFTNLPFLLRRNRLVFSLAGATVCLLLLLLSCWLYLGGWWIVGGLAITAVCLALPWGWWVCWRFAPRKAALPLGALWLSLWLFGLLAAIWAFTGGGWLLSIAFPLAAVGVAFLWLGLLFSVWLPGNWWLKSGLLTGLAALAIPVFNGLCDLLLEDAQLTPFLDYFRWSNIFSFFRAGNPDWVNLMICVILQVAALLLILIGLVLALRRRSRKD